jgi:DNA mismatch repair protein MutS
VWGIAAADLSTGYFAMAECAGESATEAITDELSRLEVREILLPEELTADILRPILAERSIAITRRPASDFRLDASRALLLDQFRVQSLEGFGAEPMHAGIRAAGALLRYLRDTQKRAVRHIADLKVQVGRDGMVLDATTQRSLEIVRNLHGGGTRRHAPFHPRQHQHPDGRAAAAHVAAAAADRTRRHRQAPRCRRRAGGRRPPARHDWARPCAACATSSASSRATAWAAPARAISPRCARRWCACPTWRHCSSSSKSALLRELGAALNPVEELREELKRGLADEPPATVGDGGAIRAGYSAELDEIIAASRDSKNWIAAFRAREAQRTGVDKLKVGFNKVFGYYIELTQAQIRTMAGGEPPSDYIRKQTLANAERFITPELKEKEDLILHAEERALALEARSSMACANASPRRAIALLANAATLAAVDCLRSLAEAAVKHRYSRPTFSTDGTHEIIDGRHPVIEAIQPSPPFRRERFAAGNQRTRASA